MLSPIPDFYYQGVLSPYLAAPACVSPERYCQIVGINERWFYWVSDPPPAGAEFYWTGTERRQLGEVMLQAEGVIESELGVPLWHKWIDDEQHHAFVRNPLLLDWGKYVCAGVQAATIYSDAPVAVDYTTPDIGVVTVAHGDVGSEAEVRVFYYDDDAPTRLYRELYPSDIDWGAANIVLTFPKWRLVDPTLMNDQTEPFIIDDDANFVDSVLVARQYSDQTDQVDFVGITESTTGYMQCDLDSISKVRLTVGEYSEALSCWAAVTCLPFCVRYVLVNYRAGLSSLPFDLEQAVVRLAHSFMPEPPCPAGHDPWVRYWERDRFIPATLSREQLNCPWGQSNGAFFAWNAVMRSPYHIRRGGAISL